MITEWIFALVFTSANFGLVCLMHWLNVRDQRAFARQVAEWRSEMERIDAKLWQLLSDESERELSKL